MRSFRVSFFLFFGRIIVKQHQYSRCRLLFSLGGPVLPSPVLGTTSLPPAHPNTAVALCTCLLGVKVAWGAKRVLPRLPRVVPTAL